MLQMLKIILSLCLIISLDTQANMIDWQWGPGFPCKKASTEVEKMICDSLMLRSHDLYLTQLYKQARNTANPKAVKKTQRAWMKKRNKCKDKTCIGASYINRINELGALLPKHKFFEQQNSKFIAPEKLLFELGKPEPGKELQNWVQENLEGYDRSSETWNDILMSDWVLTAYSRSMNNNSTHLYFRTNHKNALSIEEIQKLYLNDMHYHFTLTMPDDPKAKSLVEEWKFTGRNNKYDRPWEITFDAKQSEFCSSITPKEIYQPSEGIEPNSKQQKQFIDNNPKHFVRGYTYISHHVDLDNDGNFDRIFQLSKFPLKCAFPMWLFIDNELNVLDNAYNKFSIDNNYCSGDMYLPFQFNQKFYIGQIGGDDEFLNAVYEFKNGEVVERCKQR